MFWSGRIAESDVTKADVSMHGVIGNLPAASDVHLRLQVQILST